MDPRAAVASNNLAWMYAEKGENLDLALKLAQAAKAELPDVAEVNDTLGFVYLKKNLPRAGDPAAAGGGGEGRRRSPAYRVRLGQAYAMTGDKVKARAELEQAVKLAKPGSPTRPRRRSCWRRWERSGRPHTVFRAPCCACHRSNTHRHHSV